MPGWAPGTGDGGAAAFFGEALHYAHSGTAQCIRRPSRDLGQRGEEGTVPRYPTDGLGLIPGWVVVAARGSA